MRHHIGKIIGAMAVIASSTLLIGAAAFPPGDIEDESPPAKTPDGCVKLFGQIQCAPEEPEIAAQLFGSGPAPETDIDPARPSVVGFVRNTWPFVIDFQSEPGTRTFVKVRLYHHRWFFPYLEVAYQQRLGIDDDAGQRQLVKIEAMSLSDPSLAADANGTRVARYDIRSYRMNGDEVLREHGRPVRAPVKIFGIGAGPRAVGSITLDDVRLYPDTVRKAAPGEPPAQARFRYFLRRPFDLVNATAERDCPGSRCRQVGQVAPPGAGSVGLSPERQWLIRNNTKPGSYRLLVRAWLNCNGSTPGANFRECGNEAAWATGYSDTITVTP